VELLLILDIVIILENLKLFAEWKKMEIGLILMMNKYPKVIGKMFIIMEFNMFYFITRYKKNIYIYY
jgi:hypothetical protein